MSLNKQLVKINSFLHLEIKLLCSMVLPAGLRSLAQKTPCPLLEETLKTHSLAKRRSYAAFTVVNGVRGPRDVRGEVILLISGGLLVSSLYSPSYKNSSNASGASTMLASPCRRVPWSTIKLGDRGETRSLTMRSCGLDLPRPFALRSLCVCVKKPGALNNGNLWSPRQLRLTTAPLKSGVN